MGSTRECSPFSNQKTMTHIKYHSFFVILAFIIASYPLGASPPDWQVNAQAYEYDASIVAIIAIDGLPALSIGDKAGFFVNGEIRGVSQAVPLGGQIFHFATVYANEPVGEVMEIQVYRALDDQTYPAFTTYTFSLQDIAGNFEAPFKIKVRTDGDFPISLLSVPTQYNLQAHPFAPLDLSEYLIQTDTDPVIWSASSNPYLQTTFIGAMMQIDVTDPNWYGSTSILVRAQETAVNNYYAEVNINIIIEESYLGPAWGIFHGESVTPGNSFSSFSLEELEIQHEGNCLQYSVAPVLESSSPPVSPPNWQANVNSTPSSMPIVAKAGFTEAYIFNHPQDVLGAFINGEIRGAATPLIIEGQVLYFLQVHNELPGAEINLKFYSGAFQKIFDFPNPIPYTGISGIGSIDSPVYLDFSPFLFDIQTDGYTQVILQNEDWEGYQTYNFTAYDCNYPGFLFDQIEVTYCVGADDDLDGFCNAIDEAPNNACLPDYYPPSLSVRNELGQSISTQGISNYAADLGDCQRLLYWEIISQEECVLPIVSAEISADNPSLVPDILVEPDDPAQGLFSLSIEAVVGTNQITVISTDAQGNKQSFTYTLLITDNQAPNLVCQATQVLLSPDGTGSLNPQQLLNPSLSSDNCAITTLAIDVENFSCDDLGFHSLTLTGWDESGNSGSCTTNVEVLHGGALPGTWQSTDIGQVTQGNDYSFDPCTAVEVEDGEYTLVGSGNNATSSTTDNIAFASQTLCGDGTITAKIESISPNGYGGLMVRESNAPGAKQAAVFSNQTNILRHETRYTSNAPKQINSFFKPSPFWLRLERAGPWVFAYYSTTGFNFQYVHGVYVPMQECIEIGLSSFTFQPFSQTEAVFSHVSILEGNGLNGIETAELVSTKDFKARSGVSIFPNPVNDVINLILTPDDNKEATAILRNQMGQIIEQRQLGRNAITTEWNVSHLQPGIYLIEIRKQGGQVETVRFVKT